jgi:methionyl-tRNA formyltransferase
MTSNVKVLMFIGSGESSVIMYNGLKEHFNIVKVIEEEKVPRKVFIQKRLKKLGYFKVFGQILFMLFNKYLNKKSENYINSLKTKYKLSLDKLPDNIVENVDSINSSKVINIVKKYNPDIIIVNGTRIIKEDILLSTNAIFLNTHLGITPKYRGVHGGYWALVENDYKNCGVTVHLVDKGIDTGGILYQDTIEINNNDNFNTYPYHQISKAIPLMKKAILDCASNNIKLKERKDLNSKIWSHPTIFQYLFFRIFKKIR